MNGEKKPNTILRRERQLRGWSQQRVAGLVGTSEDVVSRWERGERKPGPFFQEKLCTLYGKSAEKLGFLVPDEEDDMKRRDANRTIAGLVSGILVASSAELLEPPLWERLSKALTQPSRVDTQSLQGLEHITKSYWQLRSSLGYRSFLKGFHGHLETVEQLLQYTQPPTVHKHLCTIASEIAQRIGAIYFDMNNYSVAMSYYKVSIEAAREADNHILWAVGLGRMSSLPIYSNNPHDAVPLLQEAQKVAVKHSPPQIAAWLASVEAEAQAHLQNKQSCNQLLGQAEHVLEHAGQDGNLHEVKFDYSRLVGYKGVCYLRLQMTNEALSALNEGAKLIDLSSVRQRSIILADSAAAYAQMGEIEAACTHAAQAIELNSLTKSSLVLQRIHQVRVAMQPWKETGTVKDFDAQMMLHTTLI